ncbi:MAG: outer membrane beta-barrel protein [Povalibacter sp.]
MRISIWLTTIAASFALANSASAADNGFYLGVGIGQSNVDIDSADVRVNGDDTAFKAIAGFRPLDSFGIEVNYVDFGKINDDGNQVEADAFSAYAVGFLPWGPVDLFAKAGVVNSDTSFQGTIGEKFSGSGTDFSYGAGVQFRLLSLSARLEYEVHDVDQFDDLNMVTLALTYTFL